MMLSYKEMESPVGKLKLVANANALVAILWERERPNRIKLEMLKCDPQQPILVETERQLQEYFAGTRNEFHLPLEPAGTEFQKKVIQKLREHDCHHLANRTEEAWRQGKEYYADTRVSLPKQVRKDFLQGNREATK